MRIKNFYNFVKENLNPESKEDTQTGGDSRFGQPEVEFDDWYKTGDEPRKQTPDIDDESDDDFDYDDYYPQEEEEDTKGADVEPFISDTDDEPEESDKDYIY